MGTVISTNEAILVEGLYKSYGNLNVLENISFSASKGMVLGVLGPNGAGKTTTVKILTTLLKPDRGQVWVNGHNVSRHPHQVRSSIGLTGQYAAVDEYLSGRENLEMMGRLYRLTRKDSRQRATQLLEEFSLADAADRWVNTYSGGMRRRLDLAISLIAQPRILFLDEPTTGLDPRSRLNLWKLIKQLAKTEVTIFLTTQHMEEADRLADNILVIDKGKVIAEGTPAHLKSQIGNDRLELTFASEDDLAKAQQVMQPREVHLIEDSLRLSVVLAAGVHEMKKVLDQLEEHQLRVKHLSLHQPTLDDVFLTLTGHKANEEAAASNPTTQSNSVS